MTTPPLSPATPDWRALCRELLDVIGSLVGGVQCGHYEQRDMWKCREIFNRVYAILGATPLIPPLEPSSCPTAPNVPPELIRAMEVAEAALADIGDADNEPTDDFAWAQARAAKPLPRIRHALQTWRDRTTPPPPPDTTSEAEP